MFKRGEEGGGDEKEGGKNGEKSYSGGVEKKINKYCASFFGVDRVWGRKCRGIVDLRQI